ncbi:MAG: HAMP domain-containing histidine kinase [Gammaproteobacteria bacterium]|nr:HAMP domain-containing histidine kinase [Gammaproteobacteria bacterium]
MPLKGDPSRAVQIGFLLLLTLTSAQVAWWIAENVHYSRTVETRIASLYREAEKAGGTLPEGAIQALAEERAKRINRYLWEGGFFLLVLVGGMSVLTSAIRLDAHLRRRQQNFLAAVSHEFKSPLASIRLSAETLVMRSGEPETTKLANRILADDERLLRMVDNLLDSARLEQGLHALKPERVELESLVLGMVGTVRDHAASHGIEIQADVSSEYAVRGDRTALETILRNFLDNALKSCVAGKGTRIAVTARREDGAVMLSVTDDGLGFEEEEAVRVFQKFYRIGDELRRTTQGTGLGLHIVKRLADLSGAKVRAESPGPGRGATFSILWPDQIPA